VTRSPSLIDQAQAWSAEREYEVGVDGEIRARLVEPRPLPTFTPPPITVTSALSMLAVLDAEGLI
jgi:hypothetical protein